MFCSEQLSKDNFLKNNCFFAKETNPDHENDKGYYSCNG